MRLNGNAPRIIRNNPSLSKRRGNRHRLFSLCLMLMIIMPMVLAAGRGQQTPSKPDSQDQGVKLKTQLIDIRAVVTDKQGKPVTGLTQDDFELLENNHRQAISFFSAEDLKTPRNAAPVAPTAPGGNPSLPTRSTPTVQPRRTIVFYVDPLNMAPFNLMRVKEKITQLINEQLSDSDMAAVVSSSGGLGVFSQFTQDKQVLRMAVNRLSISSALQGDSLFTPFLAARALQEAPSDHTEEVTSKLADASPPLAPYLVNLPLGLRAAMNILWSEENWTDNAHLFATYKAEVVTKGRELLLQATHRRHVAMLTLQAIADRLASMPGQRLIFMFSDGFTMQDDSGSTDPADLQNAVSRAARSGVIIYPIMAKGLTGPSIYDASKSIRFAPNLAGISDLPGFIQNGDRELEHGMQRIAAGTGGEAFLTTNDMKGAMGKALDANSFYYALGYYPTNLEDRFKNDFRAIKVRVKNHPEYMVRAQSGYLVSDLLKENAAAPADPMKALIKTMGEPLAATAINVAIAADFLYLPTDHAQISLNVFIDASKLGSKADASSFLHNLTLLTGLNDSSGNSMGVMRDDIQIKLSEKQLAQTQQGMYRYTKRVILKPGVYQIRVGVRDAQGEQVGTASAWVEVPDLKPKRLILSSVMTAKVQSAGEEEGERRMTPPEVRNGLPVFRHDEEISYHGWVYQAGLGDANGGEVTMRTEVWDEEKAVQQEDWHPLSALITNKAAEGIEYTGRLKAAALKPGIYTLRVVMKSGPQAKEELVKETTFEVAP